MNFNDILEQYKNDTELTRENIHQKLYDVPILHSKYSKYLYQWRRNFQKVDEELKQKYRERYYFYHDEYKRSLDKKEIEWHIQTDENYKDLKRKYDILKIEVEQLESFVDYCSKISFYCQNIINYENFINGR